MKQQLKEVTGTMSQQETVKIQHAVAIQEGQDVRALNDLLSSGWRVMNSVQIKDGALLVLETEGQKQDIDDLRNLLGYKSEEKSLED